MIADPLEDLSQKIEETVNQIASVADYMPGVIIIHNIQRNFAIEYMSPRGLRGLGVSLDEVRSLSIEEYHRRYFNREDAESYLPELRKLLENGNMKDSVSFFQQVRLSGKEDWVWHMSSVKLIMVDGEGKALLSLTMAFPIDPVKHVTSKVSRLLEENNFLRQHYREFSKLGQRERDILRLVTLGKNATEIAHELFISPATVETHRKNIKQKLNAYTFYHLAQYARAFDLI